MYKVKNCDVKNVRIRLNRQKKSTVYHKTTIYSVHFEYLTKKRKIWYPDFFPEFPDPVFSRKKSLRDFAPWKTLGHFEDFVTKQSFISPSVTWQKLADMKSAKNILFWGIESFLRKTLLQRPPLKSNFRKIWGQKFSGIRIRIFHPDSIFSGISGFFLLFVIKITYSQFVVK